MKLKSAKYYYAKDQWDVKSWVDVISIEYETLIDNYPFAETLQSLAEKRALKLLDVGCGTAIFPAYLDKALPNSIQLICDLLDVSKPSLEQAGKVLHKLKHFRVNRTYEALIEEIPTTFAGCTGIYDVIWAIHSFTTVDIDRMNAVFERLLDLLAPNGLFFVYQLTASSAYQRIYRHYLIRHPNGKNRSAYMQFEDTKNILDSMGAHYEVYEHFFYHQIDVRRPDLLDMYLKKCILDDGVNVLEFFEPLLEGFHDRNSGAYKFPQTVNFLVIRK